MSSSVLACESHDILILPERRCNASLQGHQSEPSDKGVKEEGKEQQRDQPDVGHPNVVDASNDK